MLEPAAFRQGITDDLNRFDDSQEALRQQRRSQLIIQGFYDDDGDPDLPLRDALTDLMHEAARRGVDFDEAVANAKRMHSSERTDWALS